MFKWLLCVMLLFVIGAKPIEGRKFYVVKIGKPEKQPDGTVYQETMVFDITEELDGHIVDQLIDKLEKVMKNENKGERHDSADFATLGYDFLYYSYHPHIEKSNDIYKSWYKDISVQLTLVSRIKTEFNYGKYLLTAKQKTTLVKKYKSCLEKINTLLKNPRKIEKKKN